MTYRFLQQLRIGKLSIVAIALISGAYFATPLQLLAQTSAQDFEYEDFDFWSEQCSQLGQNHQYTEALLACEKAISLKPKRENLELWKIRSNSLFHLARYAESLTSYNHVVTLSPSNSAAIAYQCASLFQLDRYNDAIDSCEQALRVDGNWETVSPSVALFYRGAALRRLGRLETALASYEQALRLTSDDASVNAERCSLLLEMKPEIDPACNTQERKMQQYYETALTLDPSNVALWVQQGLALEQIGEDAGALISYSRAIDLNPKQAIALAHRCGSLNALEEYQDALKSCEQALKEPQPSALATAFLWSQHSAALSGMGDPEAALSAAERAIAISPGYAPAWNNKAVSLWQMGQSQQAKDAIEKAIDAYRCPELALSETFQRDYLEPPLVLYRGLILAYFNQGRIFVSLGQKTRVEKNYQTAVDSYQTALDLNQPDFSTPYPNLGEDQTLQSCSPSPNEFTRKTHYGELSPANSRFIADIYVNKASALIQWSQISARRDIRLNDALTDLDAAIALNPDSFAGWYNQGLAYAQLGVYSQARVAYAQAGRLSPNNVYVLTGQGIVMTGLEEFDEAIAIFNQALAIDPNYQPAQQQREQALQQREQALQQLFQTRGKLDKQP
jgi:tetratricopeptide (TPR) repeat protein